MCSKSKGGRGVVGSAMDALRELFLTALLPDRKLRWGALGPLWGVLGARLGSGAARLCTHAEAMQLW